MVQALPPSRPIVQQDRDEILVPLVSGVKELLFAPLSPFQDRPGFVAGPTPQTGLAQAVQALTRYNCRQWAAADKSGFGVRQNQYNGEVCGPYLEALGELPTDAGIEVPFQGGQCAARYNGTISGTRVQFGCEPTPTSANFIGAQGPLSLKTIFDSAAAQQAGGLCPGFAYNRVEVRNSTGGVVSAIGVPRGVRGATLSLTRQGGLPDNCGNPPLEVQPPGTVVPVTPIPPSIEINLPGVGPINVNIEFSPEGNPIIIAPEIGAELEVKPEVEIDVGGGGGGGGAPPFDPEIGPPIESPPGGGGGGDDTGFGEPPEGRIWVGAYVELLGDLSLFGVIPRDLLGQAALSTVVGNASLNVQGDNGQVLRSTFTQIRSEWSEHIVPVVGLTVSGIRVKVNPELGYRVYPVSVADPLVESE